MIRANRREDASKVFFLGLSACRPIEVIVLKVLLTTLGIIFVAELPDKTALASLILATRYKARHVIVGAWLPFLVQTAVAVGAGGLLHLLPARPIHVASGLGLLVFAAMAFRRSEQEELLEEEEKVAREQRLRHAAWITSFLVVFAAEWGDLTQLATAALVVHTGDIPAVALGAVAALWTVTVLAAVAGSQARRVLTRAALNRASGVLFAIVGAAVLITAVFSR